MANKSISELPLYEDKIAGDETLVISKYNDLQQYESRRYPLTLLRDEIASQTSSIVYIAVSSDVSSMISQISDYVHDLSADASAAISLVLCAQSGISVFVNEVSSAISANVSAFKDQTSSDIYDYINDAIPPLRNIIGLSTLDYYTFIGDDISKLSADPKYPALSAISNDVLWFDTTDHENLNTAKNVHRLDNLQHQLYCMGLRIRDFENIIHNGIIPGTIKNNHKDEIIDYADCLEIPDDIKHSDQLISIGIYGDLSAQNGSRFYATFNPSGFDFKNTQLKWYLRQHDEDNDLRQTFQNDEYKLSVSFQPKMPTEAGYPPIIYDVVLCAEKNSEDNLMTADSQKLIDDAISSLAQTLDLTVGLNISSDYEDSYVKQYVTSDELALGIISGAVSHDEDYLLTILGNDYVQQMGAYYCKFSDSVRNLPLNTDVSWFFLQQRYNHETGENETIKTTKISVDMPDSTAELHKFFEVEIVNHQTPVCNLCYSLSNCTLPEIADIPVKLNVQSNYDSQLSTTRQLSGFGGERPDTSTIEPTVNKICIKLATYEDARKKISTLQDSEMLYFTDTKQFAIYHDGMFNMLNSGTSSGVTKDELQDISLNYLTFNSQSASDPKTVKIATDNKLIIQNAFAKDETTADKVDNNGVWITWLLQIGKVFAGGQNSGQSDCVASHNFIELTNASDNDYNFAEHDIYLMYWTKTDTSPKFEFIRLEGTIKAKSTFTIRGAQCNSGVNTYLDIDSCDMEWRQKDVSDGDGFDDSSTYSRTGPLLQFSQDNFSFLLIGGKDKVKQIYNSKKYVRDDKTGDTYHHIDMCGFRSTDVESRIPEADNASDRDIAKGKDFSRIVFIKSFFLDASKQGNKKYTDRSKATAKLWTYVDFDKVERNRGNSIQNYYSDQQKKSMKPGASADKHDFFSNKTVFSENEPNAITLTFGINGTYDDSNSNSLVYASRCLNWVSIGYFNEYVEYKKKDESWENAKIEYSITPDTKHMIKKGDELVDEYEPFHQFYDRLKWFSSSGQLVTTHKVILHDLSYGSYQYRIRRENDSKYCSEIREFTVYKNSEVENFSFIHTSDQQGFNWSEYQAWSRAAYSIGNLEESDDSFGDFKFTINTGDIAQSGNRPNEWLDYINGRSDIRAKLVNKEEMLTIGNNDLCGSPDHIINNGNDETSKFNLVNILKFYTFELDYDLREKYVVDVTVDRVTKKIPIYSLYSFNFGKWHFISLVSEIRHLYARAFDMSTADQRFSERVNAGVENWLIADLNKRKRSSEAANCEDCIIFMHEMPFTMLTIDFFDKGGWDVDGRGVKNATAVKSPGCKLNRENEKGDYRFSRLFRKYGIRLVIGGHKHTFTLSKPIYDAPEGHLYPDDNLDVSCDPFLSCNVSALQSSQPVIEYLEDDETGIEQKLESDNQLSNFARFVKVDKLTAPTYVMCQATGYKLVSNKELPCPSSPQKKDETTTVGRQIPWLLSYFAGKKATFSNSTWSTTENNNQHRPMFIRYDLSSDSSSVKQIRVTPKQIVNIWDVTTEGVDYDINNQLSTLSVVDMMFNYKVAERFGNLSSIFMTTIVNDVPNESYLGNGHSFENTYIIDI